MRYQFTIDGELSERALAAFPELSGDRGQGTTVLSGPLTDPTGVRAVLARIDNLGLTVLEMRRLPD
ncbi:hypothetical protein [Nocardia jinanensis]|uniref:Uncharacterized protein n=1 Tax=Nocardia jinanensis TaxID=382504 RepID=A0A917RRM0_9NOCA|nr:hypothetical protein [Nocardia jinanensis]GGL19925.1 hypothetical protein GCM10011588_38310 [Nocardia jinanensis]